MYVAKYMYVWLIYADIFIIMYMHCVFSHICVTAVEVYVNYNIMYMCKKQMNVGMYHAKNSRNSKLIVESCITPRTENVGKRFCMIVLSPGEDYFLFLLFLAWCIPTSPFICIHFFHVVWTKTLHGGV